VNSEELEQSLRTEFETNLKDVLAEMKLQVSDFQEKVESEFERHQTQLKELSQSLAESIGKEREIEESFKDSISEHLKLARDDSATITAAAFEEAEKLKEDEAEESVNFSDIRDAINEITGKDSQSEILKSLVHHASQYVPRGAFFIVKNEHLVGWRLFGTEEHPNPEAVRDVYFPISGNTSLSESIESLATVTSSYGTHEGDSEYLDKLGFGEPDNMYAIPLVVRGRGVAALYADNGLGGDSANIEALETLMRVAGLTVEVLAATPAKADETSLPESTEEEVGVTGSERSFADNEYSPVSSAETSEESQDNISNGAQFEPAETDAQYEYEDSSWKQPATASSEEFSPEASYDEGVSTETSFESEESVAVADEPSWEETEQTTTEEFTPEATTKEVVEEYASENIAEAAPEVSFETEVEEEIDRDASFDTEESIAVTEEDSFSQSVEAPTEEFVPPVGFDDFAKGDEVESEVEAEANISSEPAEAVEFVETEDVETPEIIDDQESAEVESPEVDEVLSFDREEEQEVDKQEVEQPEAVFADLNEETVTTSEPSAPETEKVEEPVAPTPARSRFGDRNVDLPIEVEEDERRYHNDARRFARLLVSEIKLYNEQKVKEGRESSDLYERLREAIDRSREMYDKRVQTPVASKFDYFNYELVNTLAEGEETRLGGSYPGATI